MSKNMSPENVALLYRNLAAAVRHELPLNDLFAVLKEDPDLFSKKAPAMAKMQDALKEGSSLPDAMECMPRQFPAATVELVRHAERKGQLSETLDLLADDQSWLAQTNRAVMGAVAWPMILLTFAAFILSVVVIFVIPAFQEMFSSFGANLPLPTRIVMGLSGLVTTYWWLWLALGVGGWMATKRNLLPPRLLLFMERTILLVPFVRNYVIRSFGFRLLGWLALCLQKPDMQPLVLAHIKADTGFQVFRNVLDEFSRRLNAGQALGHALDQLSPLPRRIALQIQIGEKMGHPQDAIAQAMDALETELAGAQLRFGRGIFLTSYLLVGCAIGFTVIALYMPIFMMGEVI